MDQAAIALGRPPLEGLGRAELEAAIGRLLRPALLTGLGFLIQLSCQLGRSPLFGQGPYRHRPLVLADVDHQLVAWLDLLAGLGPLAVDLGVADMALVRKAGKRINKEITDLDDSQNQMRKIGTANIVDVMDHFDLLPTHNFRFGSHPDTHKIDSKVWKEAFTQGLPDGCWLGCTMSCSHGVDHFPIQTGPYSGTCVLVDGPEYENAAGLGSNIGNFDAQKVLELNFYCDTYGVDSISFANCVAFAMECYEEGLITKEHTGGLELNFGNGAAALTSAPNGAW